MALIVNPKTKQEEKVVMAFLQSLSIGFHSEAEEDSGLLKAMEKGRKSRLLTTTQKAEFLKKLKSAK
jgi:hypothetical protein